ncbi:MAG: hypothetical protein WBX38_14770 [Candidatus Sulfotelmatobacter sp.]
MVRVPCRFLPIPTLRLLFAFFFLSSIAYCQMRDGAIQSSRPEPTRSDSAATNPDPIPANAPPMLKQTRLEIIRDFETQLFYARTTFPMGTKGLHLRQGVITPNGEELRQSLAIYGPAIKPGDPAHISFVQIKDDHIHFEINGGPVRRKKWYQRVEISGSNGPPVNGAPNEVITNPHGSILDLYFPRRVPEMTPQQLRAVLSPVFDFNARDKEQAYLNAVPPKVKEAILAHRVLVGMNTEMVLHAKGKPPRKVREREGESEYEEWIYGEPPADVDFVRIIDDEVVRVETMKVGGEKILRTEKEVVLPQSEKEARKEQEPVEHPANAPSLRRPGEDSGDVPNPGNGESPRPPVSPSGIPQPDKGPDEWAGASQAQRSGISPLTSEVAR